MNSTYKQLALMDAEKKPSTVEKWNHEKERLLQLGTSKNGYIKGYYVSGKSNLAFVRFDALNEKDYPNGISMNSIHITFTVDLFERKVYIHSNGHVYLSEKDLQTEKYRYYCMKSIIDVHTDKGGKKFRKQSFKSIETLYNTMKAYFENVMKDVEEYTGGYPYKKGIEKAAA